MIAYEVTAMVREDLAPAYEEWITGHVPELLATGCFVAAEVERAGPGRFRSRYLARSRGDLDRYLARHAARLRGDFTTRFPEGAVVSREIWESIRAWPAV